MEEALDSFGITWGFSETVKDEDISKISQKSYDIMVKAEEEFDKYLNSIGYERCMGMICKIEHIK
jgi:hypothetical protein